MRAAYNEIDRYCCDWLANLIDEGLITPGAVLDTDIRDLDSGLLRGFTRVHLFAGIGGWDHALNLAGWPFAREVWTASCPCQPFSGAGQGNGFADPRHLWPDAFRLIRERRPATIFGEQVEGPAGRAWLDLVFADLEGAGYACGAVVFPAAGVGAPHIRHRTYRVADAAGARRGGALTGAESNSRSEARLRLPGSLGGSGGLADANLDRLEGQNLADNRRPRINLSGATGGLADADQGQRGRIAAAQGCFFDRQTGSQRKATVALPAIARWRAGKHRL